jgi:DNA-binding NtrC family response regulator
VVYFVFLEGRSLDSLGLERSGTPKSASKNPKLEALRACDILILEDELLMCELVERYMKKILRSGEELSLANMNPGLAVKTLHSGWDLLHKDLSDVKVAIVDILLPQVTGVDLIRDFRHRFPNMGIIPISGMATEPMKRALKELLPAQMHLLDKPLRKEEFFQAFQRAWNFNQQPQTIPVPTLEAVAEDLWTEARSKTDSNAIPIVRRRLVRKPAA